MTVLTTLTASLVADDWAFRLRYLVDHVDNPHKFERLTRDETWPASETAVIVCDVWDCHHCFNAVRRLEEFGPRLNQVLVEARKRGATIIHAPSDCMEAYAEHPARQRAVAVPPSAKLPKDIQHWCSRIPAEEQAVYPIDQSDGGEDDDPQEHAEWAAKLKALGRNPGMPWKMQSPLIAIDGERDYISDRGAEVWSILEAKKIKRVILTGVHTNMCVLGRPFGLRQMVRAGKQVVLMRDMTDCMYNPARWPYVNHFTGNDLIIAHVERYVCPTITSEQVLGGEPFRAKSDTRQEQDVIALATNPQDRVLVEKHWSLTPVPNADALKAPTGIVWYRLAVRLPKEWISGDGVYLLLPKSVSAAGAWLNGKELGRNRDESGVLLIPTDLIVPDDANLLVLRREHQSGNAALGEAPVLTSGNNQLPLRGRWQVRFGGDPGWSNIPLPARFGASPDILFEPRN